jgi:hypothetical protein
MSKKQPNYIDLKQYDIEEGSEQNLKIGVDYIVETDNLDMKKSYYKYSVRRRLIKSTYVDGVFIRKGETEDEYKKSYVGFIKYLIKHKIIYKVTKKQ